jgi:enterobactin synthetase component D / holo-[acyl-carrier protein] synthase
VLEEILPSCAVAVSTRGDIDEPLPPEEERLVADAVEKRRREFVTGRACARAALVKLGLGPAPIGRGARGAPRWPPGIVGSITHCRGYRAATVARDTDLRAIGVDAEPSAPLPPGVIDRIAVAEERRRLRELERTFPELPWDRLLFSIKESVYKAWFPLAGRWLGFEDVVVTVAPAQRSFAAQLRLPRAALEEELPAGFSGRWGIEDGIVVTATAMPASAA